jgi:hypothetical protein
MERFLPYTHFGNGQQTQSSNNTLHGQQQQSHRIDDGRSESELI